MLLDEGYKDIEAPSVKTCFYEGRVYDDGSSWIPVGNDSCCPHRKLKIEAGYKINKNFSKH
jgi:hypothetical protein